MRPLSRIFSFGPFRFLPEQQLLLEGDSPIKIGTRALRILLLLVEQPGELIGKRELLLHAWPGALVEESNLRVNVASLRRALRDSPERPQYIAAVSGRGYRFVSTVDRRQTVFGASAHAGMHADRHNLPITVRRLIGRDETIRDVWRRSQDSRLLTITGPGGIGKTSVAIAVARQAAVTYEHGAWLVDLAPVTEGALVTGTIAAALGLTVHSEDTAAALKAFLRDRQLLLILDNCEHVIEAVAQIAELASTTAARVHLIATSREPLSSRTEVVYRLAPLDIPPDSADLTAADAMSFAAIELFVERTAKDGGNFALNDTTAPIVGDICRALDGIPLAIELVATHVSGLGIDALRATLTDRFALLNQGKRTAPARQRTLYETIEWSYQLLTATERTVLRRLSLFAGSFDLEACVAIAVTDTLDQYHVIDALANLVAKSLVSVSPNAAAPYRLLETTRAFAHDKLVQAAEFSHFANRHAEFFRDELRRAETELHTATGADWLHRSARQIDDIRAALSWALSGDGSLPIGISLVIEAIPFWSRLSLLEECREHVEHVLVAPECQSMMTDRDRMALYSALGIALLWTRGPDPRVGDALTEAQYLAERLGDSVHLTRILWELAFYHLYIGHHRSALDFLARLENVATAIGDAAAARDGRRLAAITLHYLGHHDTARQRLLRMIDDYVVPEVDTRLARFMADHRISARSSLTNVLLVQGFADRARQDAESAVREAEARGHAVSLGTVLAMSAVPVALHRGDLAEAERYLKMLTDHVAAHGLVIWSGLAECLHSVLLIMQGKRVGVYDLRRQLERLRVAHYGRRYAAFLGVLAQALGAIGERAEAFNTIETALVWSKRHEELWCLAELLRIKGWLLQLDRLPASNQAAETYLMQALEVARCQNALSWELRAAIDLTKVWQSEGRKMEARRLLLPIYERFTEGFQTADLRAAAALLRGPGGRVARTAPDRRKRRPTRQNVVTF